jgi:hypothetical protein
MVVSSGIGRRRLAGRLLTTVVFDTELVSLDLTGGPYPIPPASDPGNVLPDGVAGYGFVNSEVAITLSSQRDPDRNLRSLGQACATNEFDPVGQRACLHDVPHPTSDPINQTELDGQTFAVGSFFDVFFDITVTDGDGDLDLILHFAVQDLLAAVVPDLDSGDEESAEVALTGETVDGVLFEGSDTINFFFPGKGKGKK